MKHLYKTLALVIAALMVLTTGCSAKPADYAKTAAATCGDETIYLDEAVFWLYYMGTQEVNYYQYLYQMYGMSFDATSFWKASSGNRTQTQAQYLHEEVMAEILQSRIINSHLNEYPGAALDETDKAKIQEYVESLRADADESFWEALGNPTDERMTEILTVRSQAVKIWDQARRTLTVEVKDEDCDSFKVSYFAVSLQLASSTDSTEQSTEAEEQDPKTYKGQALADAIEADLKEGMSMDDIAKKYDNATKQTATYVRTATSTTATPYTLGKDLKAGEYAVEKKDATIYIVSCESEHDEEATQTKREEVTLSKQAEAFNEQLLPEWAKAVRFNVTSAYENLNLF